MKTRKVNFSILLAYLASGLNQELSRFWWLTPSLNLTFTNFKYKLWYLASEILTWLRWKYGILTRILRRWSQAHLQKQLLRVKEDRPQPKVKFLERILAAITTLGNSVLSGLTTLGTSEPLPLGVLFSVYPFKPTSTTLPRRLAHLWVHTTWCPLRTLPLPHCDHTQCLTCGAPVTFWALYA